ncbi:enoyl-CoA hydratase/isomerase family protein [Stygiolobus caldivivus]|nr:enoyl-CoA hydratase/isomerase family protein [Stygiolobus caldivivus]
MNTLLVEKLKDYAKITFNTGGKYNVINKEFMYEMIDTLRKIDSDKNTRFIILTGANKNFGAGADIKELKAANENREYASSFFSTMFEMYRTFLHLTKPVISLVEGVAYGASLEILLVTDVVIASPYARFAAPGAKLGVFPPVLVTVGKEVIGLNNVIRMALLGEELSAEEAKQIGLVHYVTENLETEAEKVISKIKMMAPSSVMNMRKIIFWKYEEELEHAFKTLSEQVLTRDATNGILAFLTKTKAPWVT